MERIVDRSREFLGPGGYGYCYYSKAFRGGGQQCIGRGDPLGLLLSYYNIRYAQNTVPYGSNWKDVLMNKMYPPQVE